MRDHFSGIPANVSARRREAVVLARAAADEYIGMDGVPATLVPAKATPFDVMHRVVDLAWRFMQHTSGRSGPAR